jgi:hypothetical protein
MPIIHCVNTILTFCTLFYFVLNVLFLCSCAMAKGEFHVVENVHIIDYNFFDLMCKNIVNRL